MGWIFGASPSQAQTIGTSDYCPSDPPTVFTAIGTWYTSLNAMPGTGNCAYPNGNYDPNYYVALNWSDYQNGQGCGACIVARYNANAVTVMVVDQCPSPCNVGQLDLSPQAYGQLAATATGQIDITWNYVECPMSLRTHGNPSGNIAYLWKSGCNQWYTPIQFMNSLFPIVAVRASNNGAPYINLQMVTSDAGNTAYWGHKTNNYDMGAGPFTFILTDARGNSVTLGPITACDRVSPTTAGPIGVPGTTSVQFPPCVIGPTSTRTPTPTLTRTFTPTRTYTSQCPGSTCTFTRTSTPTNTFSPTRTFTITPTFTAIAGGCNITSSQICIGADDYAMVWINGTQLAVTFNGVFQGSPIPCFNVPGGLIVPGTNTLAIQSYNTALHYNWATWYLRIGLSNGSNTYVTSNSGGVQIYNQPTPFGPPPPVSGGNPWYSPSYVMGAGWRNPVSVVYPPAFYLLPATDPTTGAWLPPLGNDVSGGNGTNTNPATITGDQLANASNYYRQTFNVTTVCPTATPPPALNLTKAFLGPAPSNVPPGQPVTYTVRTCNTGGPVTGPVTVGDNLFHTSSSNTFWLNGSGVCYRNWFDGTPVCGWGFSVFGGGPNAFGGGQGISWVYPNGFPGGGFCDTVTVMISGSFNTSGGPCNVLNNAVLTRPGQTLTSNTVNFTTSANPCTAVPTPVAATPTRTSTRTNTAIVATATSTRTSSSTSTLTRTVTPTPSRTATPSSTSTLASTSTSTTTSTTTRTSSSTATTTRSSTSTATTTRTLSSTATSVSTSTSTTTSTTTRTASSTASSTRTASATATTTATASASSTRTASSTATTTATTTSTSTVTRSSTATVTRTSTSTTTATATATVTSTRTSTSTVTLTSTITLTPTGTLQPTLTSTATSSRTATPSATATPTVTLTPTITLTRTPTPTATDTQTSAATSTVTVVLPTATSTSTAPATSTATQSFTFTSTQTSTDTGAPTASRTATPSATATSTATLSATATSTLTLTSTRTLTLSPTSTDTGAPTATSTSTFTRTSTSSATSSPTATSTLTLTSTLISTPSATSTSSPTLTASPTSTNTGAPTATSTSTPTLTSTLTATSSRTATPSATLTSTLTFSPTATATSTRTLSFTPTATASGTATSSASRTASPSATWTSTSTRTSTATATVSSTATATRTGTSTFTSTSTATQTPTITATPRGSYSLRVAVYNGAGEMVKIILVDETAQPQEGFHLGTDKVISSLQDPVEVFTAQGSLGFWDGTNQEGEPADNGQYHIKIDSMDPMGVVKSTTKDVTVSRTLVRTWVAVYNEAGERVRLLYTNYSDPPQAPVGEMTLSTAVVSPGSLGLNSRLVLALSDGTTVVWDARGDSGPYVTSGKYFVETHVQDGLGGETTLTGSVVVLPPASKVPGGVFAVTPNLVDPSTGSTVFFTSTDPSVTLRVSVYSLAGELVKKAGPGPAAGTPFDTGGLSSGCYLALVEASDAQGPVAQKVLKLVVLR